MIRSKLDEYVSSLKMDFSQGLILPTKDGKASGVTPSGANSTATKVRLFYEDDLTQFYL